eukprot:TRINITY_DN148_c0_g1_i16.p1 TRINITY_DN148_c0_g1~~TRINITY_DN148_c0_g1_i16.p1  ORF type:complete len:387 (-),score=68.33 TRINITY_DN148_c0_g1_i16:232-1392(-)
MELIQFLIILCTLKIVLRRTHCPEPSPPQDDRLASFPYSPFILIKESCPFTAWAEFADGPPLPQNVSISISIELVDNKYDVIQAGLSTSSGPVDVVEATFEGRSPQTEKFGINKTSCDVYGGCRIDEFHNHNHAMLHFRFTIRIDNMAYQYYTPGDWVLSKMPSGDRLQYFIDAQRDLPRSTCHFQTACGRRHPQHQDNNIELRYTIRVFYPAFDIQNWGLADLYQHIARCMGRVIPEAQGHHEIGGGQQIFAVYDVQEPQEAEDQDAIARMPLYIDHPEVVNPAEPANAIHNADWQLQQDFGNGEDDDIDPFMAYMNNLEQPWQTPIDHHGDAPLDLLQATPGHQPRAQDANRIAELMMTIDDNATEDNEEDGVDGKGDDYLYWD